MTIVSKYSGFNVKFKFKDNHEDYNMKMLMM